MVWKRKRAQRTPFEAPLLFKYRTRLAALSTPELLDNLDTAASRLLARVRAYEHKRDRTSLGEIKIEAQSLYALAEAAEQRLPPEPVRPLPQLRELRWPQM